MFPTSREHTDTRYRVELSLGYEKRNTTHAGTFFEGEAKIARGFHTVGATMIELRFVHARPLSIRYES